MLHCMKVPNARRRQAQLILAYDKGRRLKIQDDTGQKGLSGRSIIAGTTFGAKGRRTLLLEALEFQSEEIGFVLFEPGPH